AAAFVFAVGICFFWPTMLGFVSEYLPNTGALGLSFMGGAGMFSTSLIVPIMGSWYDGFKAVAIPKGGDAAQNADAIAGANTFLKVVIMPAILLIVCTAIYFSRKKFY